MAVRHPEIEAEQAHVDRAYARLETLTQRARERLSAHLPVGSLGSTVADRINREAAVGTAMERLASVDIGDLPLCFGRIDPDVGDRLHIGRVSVADEENEPLVVDWRAPAAAPFYRATAAEPMGLTRRRQFITRGRLIVDLDDEVFGELDASEEHTLRGEGALLAVLRRSRTGRMADIVATIQREQDEIIRAPSQGALVVQGGPGTGKTVVALHRAAYLLYNNRAQLERGGVLVLGPSRLFLRYIDRVLPSLGEHTVSLATVATLVRGIDVTATDDPAVAEVKGDERMAAVIAKAVADRQRALPRPLQMRVGRHQLTLSRAASRQIVERIRREEGTHNARRARVERLVLSYLWRQYLALWDDDSRPEATERPDFDSDVRDVAEFRQAMARMWPVLEPSTLLADLFEREALLRSATVGVLTDGERDLLSRAPGAPWSEADVPLIDEASSLLGGRSRRRVATAAPEFDRAKFEAEIIADDHFEAPLRGSLRSAIVDRLAPRAPQTDTDDDQQGPRTYAHVIVDEAQDVSPMAWRAIGRRCPSGSMTVLGDLGQASHGRAPSGWDEVASHFAGLHVPKVVELSVNYRTPSEIMELAARVLATAAPGVRAPQSVRSGGAPPEVTHYTAADLPAAAVATAQAMWDHLGDGRVAIVVPDALLPTIAALLPNEGDILDAPVAVVDVDLAKGLEFDGVVVVEPSAIAGGTSAGLRALYVALTRATRCLAIVHSGPLPEAMSA